MAAVSQTGRGHAVVVVDEGPGQGLGAGGHGPREAVEGRGRGEDDGQGLGVVVGDLGRVEPPAEALLEVAGAAERLLHRHLLVEEHPDEQGEGVGGQQLVGLDVAGEVEHVRSHTGQSAAFRSLPTKKPPKGMAAATMTRMVRTTPHAWLGRTFSTMIT